MEECLANWTNPVTSPQLLQHIDFLESATDDDLGFYRVGRDGFYYAQSISRPVPTFSESFSKVEMISEGRF